MSRFPNKILLALLIAVPLANRADVTLKHVIVYREPGRYGGWPANHGIWIWGNEIAVGFEAGYFKYNEKTHSIDWDRPAQHLLARSKDGGETWKIEHPLSLRAPDGMKQANVPVEPGGKQPVDSPGDIDFTNPNFAFTARMGNVDTGPSRFYYSYDRGRTWQGPFRMPNFGQKGIAARTDYLVNGKHDAMLFLTAAKSNGKEGRVIYLRTRDGAKTWNFVSLIGPEPGEDDMAIMPSSIRLSPKVILTAIRHPGWIDLYRSGDDGETWSYLSKPAPNTGAHHGNPPCLLKLQDGRLAITYGFRSEPYGIRARLSEDDGQSWGKEIILRKDGGTWDLGYTRTVQRPDGKMVTVYHFNDNKNTERYIAATIWELPPAGTM